MSTVSHLFSPINLADGELLPIPGLTDDILAAEWEPDDAELEAMYQDWVARQEAESFIPDTHPTAERYAEVKKGKDLAHVAAKMNQRVNAKQKAFGPGTSTGDDSRPDRFLELQLEAEVQADLERVRAAAVSRVRARLA